MRTQRKAGDRKAIFITGAASGIGLSTAKHFARHGWFVGLADIDGKGLERAEAAVGAANATVHVLDVRDRKAWARELAAFAKATDGRMDVLLNNAGVARGNWLEAQSDEDVDLQIDVNLKGVINGCRAGFDLLRATPGSTVVNVASVAGVVAPARMSVYAATKFAVRGLSEALDLEYRREGLDIGVRCIMPWFLDTPILDKAGGNENIRAQLTQGGVPIYPVEEASEAIWGAVHGKTLHHMIGAQARQTSLLARFAPGLLRRRLRRMAAR